MRCKFKLDSKTESQSGHSLSFTAVTGGSDDNKAFFKWTPSGKLDVSIVNPEIAEQVTVGAEYYLDITPAAK